MDWGHIALAVIVVVMGTLLYAAIAMVRDLRRALELMAIRLDNHTSRIEDRLRTIDFRIQEGQCRYQSPRKSGDFF